MAETLSFSFRACKLELVKIITNNFNGNLLVTEDLADSIYHSALKSGFRFVEKDLAVPAGTNIIFHDIDRSIPTLNETMAGVFRLQDSFDAVYTDSDQDEVCAAHDPSQFVGPFGDTPTFLEISEEARKGRTNEYDDDLANIDAALAARRRQ